MTRLLGGVIVFCALSPFPVPALAQIAHPLSPSREASLEKGINLFEEKRYAQARDELLRAVRADPRSARAFFYLGLTELQLGDVSSAAESFRQSTALDPQSSNAFYNLGVLLLENKKAREAIPYLERANQLGPASAALSVNLVRAYLRAGETDHAVEVARTSAARFRDLPSFHLGAGEAFLDQGLSSQARGFLEEANRLAPSELEIVLPLAEVYLRQRDPGRALAALHTIEKKAQRIAQYHYLLAQSYFEADQIPSGKTAADRPEEQLATSERTFSEIDQAIRLDPQNPLYLLTLGRFYQKDGRQQKALNILEQAESLSPKLPDVPYSIAVSYLIAGDFQRTKEYVQRALALDPAYDRAVFLLGISDFALFRYEDAERVLVEALRLNPKNHYGECFCGMVLLSEEKLAEAEKHLRRSLALEPSYALAHYQLGRLLAREGHDETARTELEQAIALEPNLYEAYYPLGHVLERLGHKAEAAQALQTFQRYRATSYSEGQELLRQMRDAIQNQP